ncbi:MAG: hypothetical protein GY866_08630, partial [Proteobacteria bacterium]|nr:hypothetical protein [Pseudomonadota bacterium]
FTDALGILPNSNTLKTSLVKLFGPTGIKITRSSITIQPPPSEDGKDRLGILPDPAKNKGAKNSQTDDIGDLEKEIERALLLSVVPKLKRTKTTTSIDDLLAQKMPLHRKLLVVVHGLFHKPWQEMIEKIVGEYQQIPWNLWNGIFFVHKSQNILAKNEEDALAIKIIFEADPTKAGQFLRKYIDDETVFEPEELPVFISAASHPLPRRVLTLFAAAFHRSFPATDRLAETVTSLDEEIAHSDDLRLQWLYSTACFKFTEDVGINTRILGRIFRRIREGQVGNLVLPFIASAVAERNGTAQQTLQEQSKNLFQEYDPILLIWMKLLEAWYNLKTNPSLLGQPPACEPGLENCAVCSPKLPGRGGFFCSMRKRFDAVDTRTEGGLGSVLNLFKAFLQLIERATGDATLEELLDIKNGPSNQDVPGIEPLKTFLLSLEERQEAGSGRSVGKTAPLNLNWFASPQECVRLMDALLTEQAPSEEFRNMAARVSESPQETKLLLDTIELPDMLVRLTRLLGMVPEWQKMGQQASIDMVMEITSNFKMDVTDTIDLKKTRFIMARIEALVAAGRIEEAVSQAKIPLNKVMSIPFESRCRQIVELCRIFQGMSSLEKVTHRNAIDDLFQDAQFFKSSKIDFSICSQYKLELLWAITEIFKSNSSNEDDAINRVVNIERNQLLRRIR